MLNIVVCDDEEYFRNKIYKIVKKWYESKKIDINIHSYKSGELCINSESQCCDIAFLDISMEQMDGIDTAKILRKRNPNVYIVFTTAYMEYALKGYEVEAIRYILKDTHTFQIKMDECLKTITEKLKYPIEQRKYDFIEKTKYVSLNALIYIESNLHKLKFHIKNNQDNEINVYTLYGKLNDIEVEYIDKGFIRIHQSYLVNIMHIKNFKRYSVLMSDGSVLDIPKNKYKDIEKKVIEYKGEMW